MNTLRPIGTDPEIAARAAATSDCLARYDAAHCRLHAWAHQQPLHHDERNARVRDYLASPAVVQGGAWVLTPTVVRSALLDDAGLAALTTLVRELEAHISARGL